jgi:drug/metabolite transporter (DMT)-like permease
MTNSRRLIFPALIAAGLLWGTTVPLSKLALGWLPPAGLAFTRFGLAALILMVISRSRLRGAFRPAILVSGALGYGGSVVLQNFGIERTSVTHAALLIGATPVLVALLAAALGHSVARPAAWAGFGLSLAGVAFIAAGRGGGATLGGDGLVLASQLASAAFTVSQARLLPGRDPVAVTAVQLLAAAFVTLPLVFLTGGLHTGTASFAAVAATVGLVVAGTVAPTALFALAQSRVSADVAGAFLNLEPLVGAIAGIVVFGNPLGPAQLAGGAAVVGGIGLSSLQVIRAERRARPGAASAAPAMPQAAPAMPHAAPAMPQAAPARPRAAAAMPRAAASMPPTPAAPVVPAAVAAIQVPVAGRTPATARARGAAVTGQAMRVSGPLPRPAPSARRGHRARPPRWARRWRGSARSLRGGQAPRPERADRPGRPGRTQARRAGRAELATGRRR